MPDIYHLTVTTSALSGPKLCLSAIIPALPEAGRNQAPIL